MRALTVERTTLESRNSGVTRMWKSDREAKATAGDRSASSEMWTWTTNDCEVERSRGPVSGGRGMGGGGAPESRRWVRGHLIYAQSAVLHTPGGRDKSPPAPFLRTFYY